MRCIECRFFGDEGDKEVSISERIKFAYDEEVIVCNGGLCRRLAPAPRVLASHEEEPTFTWWPSVLDSDWCGEFKSKEAE
jgi:hypothetical protein